VTDEHPDLKNLFKEIKQTAQEKCKELEKLDLDKLIEEGRLVPLSKQWYEVTGNIHDLPDGVGILATEIGTTKSNKPKLKLADRGKMLISLRKLC
jgi:hypothetical protein